MDIKFITHYSIHFVVPLFVALLFYKKQWAKVYVLLIAAIVIDLDHLLATPIFDPSRCSINFHPLHTYYAMVIYVGLLFIKKARVIGIGLLIHMLADFLDCYL
jgi:hypothetical protein